MLTEFARVISQSESEVRVIPDTSFHCNDCKASNSCGFKLLAGRHQQQKVTVLGDPTRLFNEGQLVKIAMHEKQVLQLSFLFYILPLLGLLAGTLLVVVLNGSETMVVVAAIAGLLAGFLLSGKQKHNKNNLDYRPVIE